MTQAEKILNGTYGVGVQILTLSAINWQACIKMVQHPSLKQEKATNPEQFRDEVKLPEQQEEKNLTLAEIVNIVTASYLLTKEKANTNNEYSWVNAKTPLQAIQSFFDWRASAQAKIIAAQARMLGMSDEEANTAYAMADAKEKARNAEAIAYAMAEVNSATNENMKNWDTDSLMEIILNSSMNIEDLAITAGERSIERARNRIKKGQFANIDPEIMAFIEEIKK